LTVVALIVSILVGTASLALGYGQAGATVYSRWFIVLALVWFFMQYRKWYWFSSIALLIIVVGAAYGVWREFPTVWMLLGAVGGLLGWDLSDFTRRLGYASPMDDTRTLERRHLERVGIVAAVGVGLALVSIYIRIHRLAFEVAVGLLLLAVLGLTRLVVGLRKF